MKQIPASPPTSFTGAHGRKPANLIARSGPQTTAGSRGGPAVPEKRPERLSRRSHLRRGGGPGGAGGVDVSRPSSGDVRFPPNFVCFTSGSGPSGRRRRSSAVDPKEKFAVPEEVEHWSLTTLREKLVKIGAKVMSHDRYVTFQLAEVAVPRELFRKFLRLIDGLRPAPLPP